MPPPTDSTGVPSRFKEPQHKNRRMCCGGEDDLTPLVGTRINSRRPVRRFTEQDEFIAAGIYRGEGSTYCVLGRRRTQYGRHPELVAGVMCDRDSVNVVARAFGTGVYRANRGTCSGGQDAWQTRIYGVSRVKEFMVGRIARGLIKGEKADQYFEAAAKCRRATEVFMKEAAKTGRPREIF